MARPGILPVVFSACLQLFAQQPPEQDVVFRSDVALVRVDVQVLDRDNRSVQGLTIKDFVLREEGKILPIRNFASDELPLDVLLLLDVSASMRPHVERIASASQQALNVLGKDDRVAIMVFDRSTRTRLPFRGNRSDVLQEFDRLLRQEHFNGGTDITRGLLDAANYVAKNARKDVRRAIVILTDDQTQRERNEGVVLEALSNAEAVLSALIAPDAMGNMRQLPGMGGGWPGGTSRRRGGYPGGGWPGSGGGWPDIMIGGGGGRFPGGGYPGGPVMTGTHSAGTPEIARDSGGDSLPVDYASSLETTLSRLRQRYSLYFQLPAGAKSQQERNIQITLAESAKRKYEFAEVRHRPTYSSPAEGISGTPAETVEVSEATTSQPNAPVNDSTPPKPKRRVAVDDTSRSSGPNPAIGGNGSNESSPQPRRGWRKVDEPAPPK